MRELLDISPDVQVAEAEYRRLLGYPRDHTPSARARELAAWARGWYTEHGRPWVYLREAILTLAPGTLQLDGIDFQSQQLRDHLTAARAQRAVLVAVSAGRACEEHARELWEQNKPDEYFFLEILGSAVVEHLVAAMSGRICDLAERDGQMAVPHYSPGYAGWDIADQHRLFDLIVHGQNHAFPENLEVLTSGMLRPKKTLLAVFGLTARTATALAAPKLVPCESCSFSPCRYRRVPYRHAPGASGMTAPARAPAGIAVSHPLGAPLAPNAKYSINPRALAKWTQERVRLQPRADGTIRANFHFDGTTCSNLGRPLAFEYEVALGTADHGYPILEAVCRPAIGDTGHAHMCAYLTDGPALLAVIAAEKPLLGQPLDEVLAWERRPRPAGCFCDAESRTHKWGLALEAIHYALAQRRAIDAGGTSATAPARVQPLRSGDTPVANPVGPDRPTAASLLT